MLNSRIDYTAPIVIGNTDFHSGFFTTERDNFFSVFFVRFAVIIKFVIIRI